MEPTSRVTTEHLRVDDTVGDLLDHPAFAGFARLLLPWDDRPYDRTMRLSNIASLLPYHSHVEPTVVVSSLDRMIDDAAAGRTVQYDFHTDPEKKAEARASRSLWDKKLPKLEDHGGDLTAAGIRLGYVDGPEGQSLRMVERPVDLGAEGKFLVSVAGDAAEIFDETRSFDYYLGGTFAGAAETVTGLTGGKGK